MVKKHNMLNNKYKNCRIKLIMSEWMSEQMNAE